MKLDRAHDRRLWVNRGHSMPGTRQLGLPEIGLGPGPRRTELLGNGELGNMVAE